MNPTQEDDTAGVAGTIAMRLGAGGITVYMTRPALEKLAARLLEISRAAPEDCFEIHLNSDFSYFDPEDRFIFPPLHFSDRLGGIISAVKEASLKEAIDAGEISSDASTMPFEVTFMHVSGQAVREEADRSDD